MLSTLKTERKNDFTIGVCPALFSEKEKDYQQLMRRIVSFERDFLSLFCCFQRKHKNVASERKSLYALKKGRSVKKPPGSIAEMLLAASGIERRHQRCLIYNGKEKGNWFRWKYIYRRGLESIKKDLKNSTTNQIDSDVATATAEQIILESTSPAGRKSQFFSSPEAWGIVHRIVKTRIKWEYKKMRNKKRNSL